MSEALGTALKLLGHRARSEAELRRRLEAKGFAAAEIDSAVARLQELRYLDDEAFAGSKADSLLHSEHQGPRRVLRKLEALGVDGEVASEAVASAQEGRTERELALQALKRRRPRVDSGSPHEDRVKAARWLLGRGFPEDVVRELLRLDEE